MGLHGNTAAKNHNTYQKCPQQSGEINQTILKQFETASEVISNIRNLRKQNNIANKIHLELSVKINENKDEAMDSVIKKMGNLSTLEYTNEKVENSFSFITKNNEYFIPFGEEIDVEAEIEKLEGELEYAKGSLNIVQKKLSNERFVNNAPEQVIVNERKKEADALLKIETLKSSLTSLG